MSKRVNNSGGKKSSTKSGSRRARKSNRKDRRFSKLQRFLMSQS